MFLMLCRARVTLWLKEIGDNANVRAAVREKVFRFSKIRVEKIKDAVDEKAVYQSYYDFGTRVDRLQPHQILAVSRGEKEGILRVHVDVSERDWLDAIQSEFEEDILSPFADQLTLAIQDSADRLLLPAQNCFVALGGGALHDELAAAVRYCFLTEIPSLDQQLNFILFKGSTGTSSRTRGRGTPFTGLLI